jgi:hypothetical protein
VEPAPGALVVLYCNFLATQRGAQRRECLFKLTFFFEAAKEGKQ